MNDEEELKNVKAYHELVDDLTDVCLKHLEEGFIWIEDIISALESIKHDFVTEDIKYSIEDYLKEQGYFQLAIENSKNKAVKKVGA